MNQIIGSPKLIADEPILRKRAAKQIKRAHNTSGLKRQFIAIVASNSRHQLLTQITAPTLVIHGGSDPVLPVSAGYKTAHLIQKSKLKIIPELGHDFPPQLMKKLAKWISKHVQKSEDKYIKKQLAKLTEE